MPGSRAFVHYSAENKLRFAKCLEVDEIESAPFSVFIGYGYLQYAGAGWSTNCSLRYDAYLVPKGYNLKNRVALAYGASVPRQAEMEEEPEEEESEWDEDVKDIEGSDRDQSEVEPWHYTSGEVHYS